VIHSGGNGGYGANVVVDTHNPLLLKFVTADCSGGPKGEGGSGGMAGSGGSAGS